MDQRYVQPLPYNSRRNAFSFLVLVFVVALPFLYLYATGYRFDMRKPTNLVSTGGIYVAVDRAGAEIYIDGELVRETRTFRRAFYAQNLDIGTHRLHVQKEGHHTWVKELPVAKRLVTEASAFNFPLIPDVRVIGKWETATGSILLREEKAYPRIVNPFVASTTIASSTLAENLEYRALLLRFATTTGTSTPIDRAARQLRTLLGGDATTTDEASEATSTITAAGVRLSMKGDDLFATWVGQFEQMPYYYCAPDFPPYSTSTLPIELERTDASEEPEAEPLEQEITMHPVQTVPKDAACDPTIRIDRKGQVIRDFEFFPGSNDLVVVVLEDGIYVVEIDDRGWQNVQPLMLGDDLSMYIENGNIFVYDGELIYQLLLQTE